MFNVSEPKPKSKKDKTEWSIIHGILGRVVQPSALYIKEYGTDGIQGVLSTIHQNYYAKLCKLDEEEMKNIDIAAVGA